MKIISSAKSDNGRVRDNNEDAFLCDSELGLYAVCDGMGGHAAGEVAAALALETLKEHVQSQKERFSTSGSESPTPEAWMKVIREGIEFACQRIYDLGRSSRGKHGMGTTCTALLLVDGKGVMGHVGDSRLYMLRNGRLSQLSEDHNYIAEALKLGVMTQAEVASCPFNNIITRAVGVQSTVCVDGLVFDVLPEDRFLICSDGLTNYFESSDELRDLIQTGSLKEITDRLIDIANGRGGEDNITALLLRAATDETTLPGVHERKSIIDAHFEALRHVILFRDLNMAELVRIYNLFRPATYQAGDIVIKEGDVGNSLFVIVEGTVRVDRGGEAILDLDSGSHFGEIALLNLRPRTATVRAVTPLKILELERGAFNRFVQHNPGFAAMFLWVLAQGLSLQLDDVYSRQRLKSDSNTTLMEWALPSPFRSG